ncbi:MAG TPA: ATP-binding cassette domain-containing protein [Solirubrobacteraceae bacterium]|jgi:ABC-2 type transport system ATP-binding protein|nr:ATP-binding cassette domain-containing protein [Solirubrobacteraceae bacterium]
MRTTYTKPHPPAVEVEQLTKTYGDHTVLDGLELRMERGSVLALLGPNGAGKTTTVRILATLLHPDGGRARVAGHDVVTQRHQVRRRISLTGQYVAVDGLQSGRENLQMLGRMRGLDRHGASRRADELLGRFDLVDAAERRVATYSGGMRRRLDLAASLLGDPEVIFLDEPSTGLDPRSRQALWEVVLELAASGVGVFLTTQYLEEADRLADRIAVLDGGRVVAEGSAAELKRRVAAERLEVVAVDERAYALIAERAGERAFGRDAARRRLTLSTDGSAARVRALLDELDPAREAVASFAVHEATLEEVFLCLTR